MNHDHYFSCQELPHRPDIKTATKVCGIELEEPIDISKMTVMDCSTEVLETENGTMKFNRKVRLRGWDTSEGSEDEIEITIIRKSPRIAKTI